MVGVVMVAVGLYGGFRATRERRRRAKESKDAGHAHHDHSHCHAHGEIHNSRDAVLALGVGVVHGLTHIVWVPTRFADAPVARRVGLPARLFAVLDGPHGPLRGAVGRCDATYQLRTRHLCVGNRVFTIIAGRGPCVAGAVGDGSPRRLGVWGPRPRSWTWARPRPRTCTTATRRRRSDGCTTTPGASATSAPARSMLWEGAPCSPVAAMACYWQIIDMAWCRAAY